MLLDEQGVKRLTALFDGIMAVAMTILILPLTDSALTFKGASLFDFFNGPNGLLTLTAIISFAILLDLWLSHHMLFAKVKSISRRVFLIHAIFQLLIIFIPLFTRLVSLHLDNQVTSISYLVIITVMYAHLPIMAGHLHQKITGYSLWPIVAFLIVIMVDLFFPGYQIFLLVIVLIITIVSMFVKQLD